MDMDKLFHINSDFLPQGDQPEAIESLSKNIISGIKSQTLLGVTGSGKTFTIANVIANVNKPTIVMAHNKTLAAQLYEEFKDNEDIVFLYLSKEDMDVITDYIPKDESLQKLPLYKVITDDELFKTRGIPTTFIVDRSGEILVEDVGSASWNDEEVINYLRSII